MAQSSVDAKVHLSSWSDSSAAEKYARAELATRPFADVLVQKSGLATSEGDISILDIAAGTGAIESAIYCALPKEKWNGAKIISSDISVPMLEYLKARAEKESWVGLETMVVDGNNIDLPPNAYTHLFINFGIFMLPSSVLPTCHTLLQTNGVIGISTWSFLPWIPIMARAIERLPSPRPRCPSAAEVEAKIYKGRAWNLPSYVGEQLRAAGFDNVQVLEEKRNVKVGTPEQFMEPMHMPLTMVSTFWEEEMREGWIEAIKREMVELLREEAEEGLVRMTFEAILGLGWKTV